MGLRVLASRPIPGTGNETGDIKLHTVPASGQWAVEYRQRDGVLIELFAHAQSLHATGRSLAFLAQTVSSRPLPLGTNSINTYQG